LSWNGGLADYRRLLRFAASAALAALLGAGVTRLNSGGVGLALAGLASLAALWLVLRYPRPAGSRPDRPGALDRAGRLILLVGLALMALALAVSRGGEQGARIAVLCEGQSAQMGGWNFKLERVTPVAGEGYTALAATIRASRANASPVKLVPQQRRSLIAGAPSDPVSRASLWRGDLALAVSGFDPVTGCLSLDAVWRPLAGGARAAGWLAAFGAALMALTALGSLNWRRNARERIAMRRSDRPLLRPVGQPVGIARRFGPVAALVLALCFSAWLALGSAGLVWRPAVQAPRVYAHGAALVAARQSLLEGPANTNRWIVIGDAMVRRGHFADAAGVLLGAVEANPRDSDGWLALGDALYAHAGGQMSPAAALAYDRGDRAALDRGAALPPAGLAMEQSGRSELAQMWWRRHLSRPAGSVALRAAITARLNYSAP
jgi:cytochrome c-type biogenesis protein CcmH